MATFFLIAPPSSSSTVPSYQNISIINNISIITITLAVNIIIHSRRGPSFLHMFTTGRQQLSVILAHDTFRRGRNPIGSTLNPFCAVYVLRHPHRATLRKMPCSLALHSASKISSHELISQLMMPNEDGTACYRSLRDQPSRNSNSSVPA